jgi:Ca-activated chloride channel family protein
MKQNLTSFGLELKSVFEFHWENPVFLYLLPLPFLLFLIKNVWQRRKRSKIILSFPTALVQNKLNRILSFIPDVIQGLLLLSLIIAISKPYKAIVHHKKEAQGIDIALAIDLSSSMLNNDVKPTRLEVAKNVAIEFIKKRHSDPIALIAFAGEPYLASPITLDNAYLQAAIGGLDSKLIQEEGTALGDALGMAINQLRDNDNPKKICIIISDGNNTAGNLDPIISAKLAKKFQVKVYTIAVGDTRPSLDPVDESTLRTIAEKTNGKFFRARNKQTLQMIFQEIDQLEKTKINYITWTERQNQSFFFVKLAFVLFVLGLLLRLTWISNMLED